MPEINYKKVVETALNEVGYQGQTKNSKYTQFLDSVNWYNGKKAGACTWCAIFYDYCVAVNKGELSYEQARQVVCEPSNAAANTGAGCTQHAQMYKDKGRWISSVSKATTGDQVFFKKSNGSIYHTGILVDWNGSGIYTVEGSTDGAKVSKRFYSYSDPKLAGFGRPDWYKYQTEAKPDPKPSNSSGYTDAEIQAAYDCIEGKYGNGQARGNNLTKAGFDYYRVQGLVNKILKGEFRR